MEEIEREDGSGEKKQKKKQQGRELKKKKERRLLEKAKRVERISKEELGQEAGNREDPLCGHSFGQRAEKRSGWSG